MSELREQRIFLSGEEVQGALVRFSDENLHHLRRVLRLRAGGLLRATDGTGAEYLLRLENREGLCGTIVEVRRPERESPLEVTLVQSLPRKDLMEGIVQRAVELGVREIRPVVTERSVVALREQRLENRTLRWRKVLEASVAQSGRTVAPLLREVLPWKRLLEETGGAGVKLLLDESEERTLAEVLEKASVPRSLILAVGPEGGWDPREVAEARRAGFLTVGLGPRILRTGTAGLAALSIVQYLYGDLGRPRGGADSEKREETV